MCAYTQCAHRYDKYDKVNTENKVKDGNEINLCDQFSLAFIAGILLYRGNVVFFPLLSVNV